MTGQNAHALSAEATALAVHLAGAIIQAEGGKWDAKRAVELTKEIRRDVLPMLQDGPGQRLAPPVSIAESVGDNYIICLEDGKKLKLLKRHLKVVYGMTPEEYRRKWNLPADYPMAAPSYSRARSAMARRIGLGHKKKAA